MSDKYNAIVRLSGKISGLFWLSGSILVRAGLFRSINTTDTHMKKHIWYIRLNRTRELQKTMNNFYKNKKQTTA